MGNITSVHMQACKVGSSETHNLREKQLSYVVPEMSHLNESVIHEHIPDALARIEAKYTEVTGQRMQPTATPLKEAVLVIRDDTTIEQVEKFGELCRQELGISGVLTNYCAWRTEADEELGIYGTQIALLLDRKDNIINICEMKYSSDEYVVTKDYDTELRRKKNAFKVKTKTRKALHVTMVTTYSVHMNMYSGNIQSQVTMDDLFVK